MKSIITGLILLVISSLLIKESLAQYPDMIVIQNVPEEIAWEIVYQGFNEQNIRLNNYNRQTGIALSNFFTYTSMLIDNRAKYQVKYINGNIEISLVNRQYMSTEGWADNLFPLSKKSKKKFLVPLENIIMKLLEDNPVTNVEEQLPDQSPMNWQDQEQAENQNMSGNEESIGFHPIAIISCYPVSGSTSIDFELSGKNSFDYVTLIQDLKFRWDLDNDGNWDDVWSANTDIKHRFSSNGIHTVRMEVMDTDENIHETTHQILVEDFTPCPDLPTVTYLEQTYNTVLIGDQCWMRENLNAGDMIFQMMDMKNNGKLEKYCYDNYPEFCKKYGGLYQWGELMEYKPGDSTGICPEGWHIPSVDEFDTLFSFLGGINIAGERMKEKGSLFWPAPETIITNHSGYAALPGGKLNSDYRFYGLGTRAYLATTKAILSEDGYIHSVINPNDGQWNDTKIKQDTSFNMFLFKDSMAVEYEKMPVSEGVSVRCIKNGENIPEKPVAKFHYYHPVPYPDHMRKPYNIYRLNPFPSYDMQDPDSELKAKWTIWYWNRERSLLFSEEFNPLKIKEETLEQDHTYLVRLIIKDTDGNTDTTFNFLEVEKNTPPHAILTTPFRGCVDSTQWLPFKAIWSWDREYHFEHLTYSWNYDFIDGEVGNTSDNQSDHIICYGKEVDSDHNYYYQPGSIRHHGQYCLSPDNPDQDFKYDVRYFLEKHSPTYLRKHQIMYLDPFVFGDGRGIEYIPEDTLVVDRSGITIERDLVRQPYMWSTRHRYFESGNYRVRLIVTDPEGLSDTAYAEVCIDSEQEGQKDNAPNPYFEVYPGSGTLCDTFTFDASCSYDTEDPLERLEFCWFLDWSRHKKYPHKDWSKDNMIVKYQYGNFNPLEGTGSYSIRLGVRDTKGKTKYYTREFLEVEYEECNSPPVAAFTINPSIATPNKAVILNASESYDNEDDISLLHFRWDFYGDGKYDTEWSNLQQTQHAYKHTGKYGVKLQVKDSKGDTSHVIHVVEITENVKVIGDTPLPTNCPKKEYELYFPFDEDKVLDSLDTYAALGYKLIAGSIALCIFEKETNGDKIYPLKVLEKSSIDKFNELAKEKWIVVSELLYTFLIQDIDAPLYEYTYSDDLSYYDLRQCENFLPGGDNISVFNEYGSRGWEIIGIPGKALFRKNKDENITYQYKSFNINVKDFTELEQLGKEGWQYGAMLHVSNCLDEQMPIILKRRTDMGDVFYYDFATVDKPSDIPSFVAVMGNPEKEKQMIEAFNPLYWQLNKHGQGGWTLAMFTNAHEEYFGKDKVIIVFQTPVCNR